MEYLQYKCNLLIQIILIISIIAFSLETLPNLEDWIYQVLKWIHVFTVFIFTIEYMVRIIWAPKKLKYIFSFMGIVDLLSILPFTFDFELQSFKAIRILTLLRFLKFLRYSKAVKRFTESFHIIREEILLFFMLTSVILFITASGIYYFENEAQPENFSSIFDSFWWSIVTLTTVGYGDIYPVTTGGRIFTIFILFIGLGVVSVPASLLSSAFSITRIEENYKKLIKDEEKKNTSNFKKRIKTEKKGIVKSD